MINVLLKLKNGSYLSLRNLIEKATAAGGEVKHIELTSQEAFDLLREINSNRDIRKHYSYDEDDNDYRLGFRLNGNLNSEDFTKIANEWHKQKIGIRFDKVPLYIVVPPPAKKEEPSTEGSVRATKLLTNE